MAEIETFLDLVREVAERLQCKPDDELPVSDNNLDLMMHRYEAFTVLWTVANDPKLMQQMLTSGFKLQGAADAKSYQKYID